MVYVAANSGGVRSRTHARRDWWKITLNSGIARKGQYTSIRQQFFHLHSQVLRLWKNSRFEPRVVPDPGVHGAHAPDRRIQAGEELVGDARRDFRAITPRKTVFVRDDDAAGLLHRRADRFPVVGRERPQIDDL